VSHSAVESLLFRARQQVRALVAGTNVAAVPVALRDELVRLIPGFDPGSASVVARVAALPVAWKLASTAVGVGVVATGAGGLHHDAALLVPREPVAQARQAPTRATLASVKPRVAQQAAPSVSRRHGRRAERRRHDEIESTEHEREDPAIESTGSQGPGPAPVDAQTASPRQSSSGPGPGGGAPEADLEDDSGSGHSGHGGGSESDDSGHSGPG
jgi:hypothetical protein